MTRKRDEIDIYVRAPEYDRVLKLRVKPTDTVLSVKKTINKELGGNVPEDYIDSINYVGVVLSCKQQLKYYGIGHHAMLHMNDPKKKKTKKKTSRTSATPEIMRPTSRTSTASPAVYRLPTSVTRPLNTAQQQQAYQAPAQPAYQAPAQVVYQAPAQTTYQQPAYQQPTYQQTTYQQPAYQQPAYQQPAYQQPAYQDTTYQQPAYQQTAYQQPAYQQQAYQYQYQY
jgi:hypothetical protein